MGRATQSNLIKKDEQSRNVPEEEQIGEVTKVNKVKSIVKRKDRSSSLIDKGDGCDEKPKAKKQKVIEKKKKVADNRGDFRDDISISSNNNAIVASPKALIYSIRGKKNRSTPKTGVSLTVKQKADLMQSPAKKAVVSDGIQCKVIQPEDENDYVDANFEGSEDDSTSDESHGEESMTEQQDSGSDLESDPDLVDFHAADSEIFFSQQPNKVPKNSDTEDEGMQELKRNPKVQKLLKRVLKENSSEKNVKGKFMDKDFVNNGRHNKQRKLNPMKPSDMICKIKSPSNTTVYTPALKRNYVSPVLVQTDILGEDKNNAIDQISNFVERIRLESNKRETQGRASLETRLR